MIYWQLLWSFSQIGLFSIGGGYAAMPLIQHQVVEVHPWLTLTEFTDIVTLSQMTPGPIAINSATVCGHAHRGYQRRADSHRGLCAALLRDCAHPGLGLLPLPQPVGDSGRTGRRSPRRGGDDRIGGPEHIASGALRQRSHQPSLVGPESAGHPSRWRWRRFASSNPIPIWVMAGAACWAASCTRYRESAEHPLQLLVFFVGDECVVLGVFQAHHI